MMKKLCSILTAGCLLLALLPLSLGAAAEEEVILTFSDTGIVGTAGEGYTVEGTALTVTAPGVFRLTGSCAEGSVTVEKKLSGVTLILEDLTLSSSATAPVVIKKNSSVTVELAGVSTLTDNEDPAAEETDEDFEGAAVKVKSGSSLTIEGEGTLIAMGNAKNGLKGGAESSLTVNGGTLDVTALNNGVAFDGSVVITGGSLSVTADNDGVKAVPDEGDTASAGTVTVTGGSITLRVGGDGVQAGSDLTVTGGTFDIRTMDGYQSLGFDADTMSCKGLKASGTDEETEDAANTVAISGGVFTLNTADDAIHSDGYAVITGGTFYIYTGDDGVHADTSLTLGSEGGYERDPEIYVYSSYEGLEAGTVYAYSGKYYIVASDDGVNAAGGSSNGTDPGMGGDGHFNPGGGPGRPGDGWGGGGQSGSGDYSLNFYGGAFYVDCTGDGLDSNGALNLYGGTFTVLSMASGGDNSPLDFDGTLLISGATVFAAGSNPMNERPASSGQKYYVTTARYSAGTTVNVSYGGSLVYSEKLPRNINYLLYSSPEMTSSSCTVTTGGSVDPCRSNAWAHNWDEGQVQTAATEEEEGVTLYTCRDCGATERKTLPALTGAAPIADGGDGEETGAYTAAFVTDSRVTVDVYYTQDYTAPDETGVASALSRDGDTGAPDGSGDGQINFRLVIAEGYELTEVTVEGSYKNLKDISTDEIPHLYRITKVAGDLTVTVTAKAADNAAPMPGDVDRDGKVTSTDARLTLQYGVGKLDGTALDLEAADVDGDGAVTSTDARLILQYAVGKIAQWP